MKFEFVDENVNKHAEIKVMGVGGAGGNAVNNMIASKLKGVDFVVANTDCQDLERSSCSDRVRLGPSTTMGLGAGADPEIGKLSAEESINEIREIVDGPDMVFITAGMGGGTGTGASPVVARECKECKALTVAVVTKPFNFEGEKRMKRAMEGIENLKKEVDSLIVIPNERLKALGSKNATLKDLFARADEVLLQAVRGISDLIRDDGLVNLDFADVKKAMEQPGTALMGMGRASGESRTAEAAQEAINSPLLEDISIHGAKGLLLYIAGPSNITFDEVEEASNLIKQEVNDDAEVFWGVGLDDTMEDEVQVTVIATGIDSKGNGGGFGTRPGSRNSDYDGSEGKGESGNVVNIRDLTPSEAEEKWIVRMQGVEIDPSDSFNSLETPAYQRKGVQIPSTDEDEIEINRKKKGFLSKFRLMDNLEYPTFLRMKAD